MTWRVARSLLVLRDEVDALAPQRSTLSDGTIGNTEHSSRASDHNPNPAGVVRAMDITHDPKHGLDCNDLALDIADLLGVHPALGPGAYVIWNARIVSTDRAVEGWRRYSGSNPHDHHMHVSTGTRDYDDETPWLEDEDDMADYAQQLDNIAATQRKIEEAQRKILIEGRATRKVVTMLVRKNIANLDAAEKAILDELETLTKDES